MNDVTMLLADLADGRESAADELFPLVYDQLRALAAAFFRDERVDHTMQPTALVHEAYLRLVQPAADKSRTRVHFQALAARVMRHVLVDHARQKASEKRGGDRTRIALHDDVAAKPGSAMDFTELNEALQRLGAESERAAKVVELRFFGNLTHEEIATVLGISLSSVEREWRFARAWLLDALGSGDEGGDNKVPA